MKKLFLIAITSLLSVSAFAQGTVNFSNTASTTIVDPRTGLAATAGQFTVALYWGVLGTADANALVQIGATTVVGPGAGRYGGGTRTTGVETAPGQSAVFQIRAWESIGGSTYEQAFASGSAYYGSSALFTSATGGAGSPPSATVNLAGIAPGFTMVPEPSTFALGALGIGALLMVRRRKV